MAIIVGAILIDGIEVGSGVGTGLADGLGVPVGDGVKSTHVVRSRLEKPLSQRRHDSVWP